MNAPWTTCPYCGWDFRQHGDTHRSTRFKCQPLGPARYGNYDFPKPGQSPGTISQAAADAQTERVKTIMADTGKEFSAALDVYIEEALHAEPGAVDQSGWDAA